MVPVTGTSQKSQESAGASAYYNNFHIYIFTFWLFMEESVEYFINHVKKNLHEYA